MEEIRVRLGRCRRRTASWCLEKCMRAKSALEFGTVYMYTYPTRTPYYSCGIIAAALEDLSVLYVLTPNLASSSVPTYV